MTARVVSHPTTSLDALGGGVGGAEAPTNGLCGLPVGVPAEVETVLVGGIDAVGAFTGTFRLNIDVRSWPRSPNGPRQAKSSLPSGTFEPGVRVGGKREDCGNGGVGIGARANKCCRVSPGARASRDPSKIALLCRSSPLLDLPLNPTIRFLTTFIPAIGSISTFSNTIG